MFPLPPFTLTLVAWLVGAVLVLIVASRSFTIAKGNQVILLERRWFGRQMPDGRTVALSDEVACRPASSAPGSTCSSPSSTG